MRFLCCVVVVVVSEWSIDLNWVVGLKLPWCLHGSNPPFNGEVLYVRTVLYVRIRTYVPSWTFERFICTVRTIHPGCFVRPSSVPEFTWFQARMTYKRFAFEMLDVLLMDESPNAIAWHFFLEHTQNTQHLFLRAIITNEHMWRSRAVAMCTGRCWWMGAACCYQGKTALACTMSSAHADCLRRRSTPHESFMWTRHVSNGEALLVIF